MSELRIERAGHVAVVEICRPPDNYFDKALIRDLAGAFELMDENPDVRSLVLCSAGRNFCAGANFTAAGTLSSLEGGDHLYRQAVRLFRSDKPVIAAVQGAAVGGGLGLALAADFRIGSPSRFAANFNRIGIHPGFGLSLTLPRAVGAQRAGLLLYTGQRIGGQEALEMGLIDRLVPDEELRTSAVALAADIAQSAPDAVVSTRRTLRRGLADEVASAVEHELAEQLRQFESRDFREGVRAMAERRPPRFTGE